jgi:hypothetical protein
MSTESKQSGGGSNYMNFKLNTFNYLGFQHQEYLANLTALSLTKPSEYYKMRANLLKELKEGLVTQTFETYYILLTDGKVGSFEMRIDGNRVSPSYPEQDASAFAIKASKTINQILDECMEIVMPSNHLDLAKTRLIKGAEGKAIE